MPITTMEQYVTSLIERRVPYNGPVLSDEWNDTNEELVRDITTLQTLWNTLLYPLLGSMPNGPVEILATDRTGDVSPFDNGLDGSQLYMDMTALATDESYYSETLGRPYTIKESFEVFESEINIAIEDAKEAALLAGLTEDAKQKIGARIFYTGRVSDPDSLDGLTQRLDLLTDQLVADVFNEGFDAGAPPDYSSYPLSGGLQSRDNSVMELVASLLYMHDNSLGFEHVEIHHIFVDPALEGSLSPQVISNMVKAVETVDGDFKHTSGPTIGQWPGQPGHLEDELNQVRTAIRRLAGYVGTDEDYNTIDASVAVWTYLPDDSAATANKMSLKGHINNLGTGVPVEGVNPHGYSIGDIDDLQDLIALSLITVTADDVEFTPTTGPYLTAGLLAGGGENVQNAVELLEDQIAINETDIATNVADILVNTGAISANAIAIAANLASIGVLETYQALHETYTSGGGSGDVAGKHEAEDIDLRNSWKAGTNYLTAAGTVRDALAIFDGMLLTLTTNLAAQAALYADHKDGIDDRHNASHIDFSSNTSEPLEYPADPDPPYTGKSEGEAVTLVSDAINVFQQLWINDRRVQDAKINAAGQEIQRYATANLPTLFAHNFEIYVDPDNGEDVLILGDGTAALPYKTIGRALMDIGKMIIPKAEIILVNDNGASGADFNESVLLDNSTYELGELVIRSDDPANPSRFRINGGSRIEQRVWFYGGGIYDIAAGGTYVPTVPGEKTTFYVEIVSTGQRTYVQGEDLTPEIGNTSFDLAGIPDDDAAVTFTDTTVTFILEVPWSTYPAALAAGTYRINYKGDDALPATRVETGTAVSGGTVDYYTVDWPDKYRWWKDNDAPPDDYDEWDDATAYVSGAPGDLVSHASGWYECIVGHTDKEPMVAVDWATYWSAYAVPTQFSVITEETQMALDQGVTILFLAEVGHTDGDVFFFSAFPALRKPLTFISSKGVKVQDVLCDGGILVDRKSDVDLENIIAKNSIDHAILVTGGSKLRVATYDIGNCPGNGLHARENSYILALDYDGTLDPAHADVTGWGGYAEWHSGIENCVDAPAGVAGGLSADAASFGYAPGTCPTSTTSSSTTTTSTSSSTSTSTSTSTSSSTSTSTVTTVTPPP